MKRIISLIALVVYCIHPLLVNGQELNTALSLSGIYDMRTNQTAIDAQGNIYATGYFVGTVDFDPNNTTAFNLASNSITKDIFILKLNSTGGFVWAQKIGSSSVEEGTDIDVDANGNVIVTGHYKSTVDFNPGTATNNLYNSDGDESIFILKLDSLGNYVHAFSISSQEQQVPLALTIDLNNNILICGYFHGSVNFNPAGSNYLSNISSGSNIFIAKYTNTGGYLWAKNIGPLSSYERAKDITTDMNGDVYVTGNYEVTTDFDPSPSAVSNIIPMTNGGTFILKLNANGNFVWVQNSAGISGYGIAVDQEKSVYICGDFWGPTDFDPGAGVLQLTTSTNGYWCFISKYDSVGNFQWVQLASPIGVIPSTNNHYAVTTDNQNNVYFAGAWGGTFDFDRGPDSLILTSTSLDACVSKKDKNGNLIWAISMGGTGVDNCTDIAVQPNGKLIAIGNFEGTADFDPTSTGTSSLTSTGQKDGFITILNNSMFPLSIVPNSLEAYQVPSGIELRWTNTYVEDDNFTTLQRSDDGVHFSSIQKIKIEPSIIGAKKDYFYIDQNAKSGINFYRLMDEDIDGKLAYSNVISIFNTSPDEISIYPNPAKNQLFVNSNKKNLSYQIENQLGQIVKKGTLNPNKAINIEDLHLGIYFMKINNQSFKFIKE